MRYSLILFLIPIILFSKELTLSVALANALQSNQDLSLMEHDYQRLREAEQSSKLDFFGKVEAKVEMNHYNTPRTLMPLSPPISSNVHTSDTLWGAHLMYTVPLFDGFATMKEIEISHLNVQMQQKRRFMAEGIVRFNVKATYIKLVSLQKQLRLNKDFIVLAQRFLEEIVLKKSLGKASELDILQAKVALSAYENKAVILTSEYQTLKSYLAFLMAQENNDFEVEEVAVVGIPLVQRSDLENLSSLVLAKLEEQKKEYEYEKSKAAYYPKVEAMAVRSQIYGEDGNDEAMYQLGVSFKWLLLDFGKRGHAVQKSQIDMLKARQEHSKKKLEILKTLEEVKQKWLKFESLQKRLEEEWHLKKHIATIETVKYEEGRTTALDRLKAHDDEANTLLALIDAGYNQMIAGFEWAYVMEQ